MSATSHPALPPRGDEVGRPKTDGLPADPHAVDDYIRCHIDPESDYLHRLWRDTQLRLSYGQMASGHVQGRLLAMLTRMIRPRLAVELGTFSGYSALCIAEGMDEGCLHTFEICDEQEDFTRPWLEGSPHAARIRFHIGDALRLIPEMDLRDIDMAFIDADKRAYVDFYEMLLPRMRSGGFILADNTLWYGHVVEPDTRGSDRQTLGIKAFNDHLAQDSRVEKVILPLRDGLTLIRKK